LYLPLILFLIFLFFIFFFFFFFLFVLFFFSGSLCQAANASLLAHSADMHHGSGLQVAATSVE